MADRAPDDPLFLIALELGRLADALAQATTGAAMPQLSAAARDALMRLGALGVLSDANRAEFFIAAATAIRAALGDRARRGTSGKRTPSGAGASSDDLLALDGAIGSLKVRDSRLHDVVLLRFFGGLSVEQAAAALALPADAVASDWSFARAWLLRQMRRSADGPGPEQAA